jgi:hypothetical protein
LAKISTNILLKKSKSGLKKDSVINTSQVFTVNKSQLTQKIRKIPSIIIIRKNALAFIRSVLTQKYFITVNIFICKLYSVPEHYHLLTPCIRSMEGFLDRDCVQKL